MSEQTDHVLLRSKRRRAPKHNWPMHVVVWLDHLARVDPERLRVSSIAKLAEAACDHLVTTIGWAPQEDRPVRELIAEWMKARARGTL